MKASRVTTYFVDVQILLARLDTTCSTNCIALVENTLKV